MFKSYSMELAGRTLTVEVGRVAKQASGAAFMITEILLYYRLRQHLTSQERASISSR